MKNTIKLLALACVATVMLTACSNENVTPAVNDSTPVSSAAVSSQTEETSAPQQIDDDNNAPYTVRYDIRDYGDLKDVVVVTGYTNDKYEEGLRTTRVVVGDTYEGKPIEGVYQMAFHNRKDLKSVVLPDSIYFIGNDAFKYCESLESITMPANLDSIGSNTFQYCYSLKEITFPDSLKNIGAAAFNFCESLENVVLPDSVEYIGGSAFADCRKIQVTFKGQTYDYAHIEDLYKAVNGE